MQLPLASRREIIEDLLDIQIFTNMNVLLKEKINVLKEEISVIEGSIGVKTKDKSPERIYRYIRE